jgi:hypothetical protein
VKLGVPQVLLILQKVSVGFGNPGEVWDEPLVITSQPEETVDLMHSPWMLPI